MVTMAFPPPPPFHSLRLATAADVTRMADLSVLGFKDSEIFRYERPRYSEFPHDAVASFSNLYRSRLQDPCAVVIVAEDWPRPDEQSHFTFSKEDPPEADSPMQRRVVGVASWILPKGSPRTGQFVVPGVGDPEPAPHRDLCQHRLDLFTRITEATEEKYLAGKIICDKFVVHPSYQHRGHGTFMLQWGLALCNQDGVDQGVIPSHAGEPVYLSMGYEVIGEMQVPDDGEVQGFSQRVAVYKAKQKA